MFLVWADVGRRAKGRASVANRDTTSQRSRTQERPRFSLRALLSAAHPGSQFAALVVPVVLLFTAAAVTFAWSGHQRSIETADRESQLLASAAAVDAQRFLANRVELLNSIIASPALRDGDLREVQALLSDVVALTGFSEIGWIDVDGYARAIGGVTSLVQPLYIGDRPHIRRALETGRPVVGDAQVSRASQEPTFNVVVPVQRDGRLVGLLAGAVRLNGAKASDLRFGDVPGLRVVDGAGQLAITGERGGLDTLESVAGWPGYAGLRAAPQGVLHEETGLLGEPDRVVGFAAVPGSDWVVVVDRAMSEVYGPADRTLRAELLLVAIFAAGSLLLIAWVGFRLEAGAQRLVLFVDTLAHDVGTPLTVIRAFSTRLRRAVRHDPTLLASVAEIDRAGRRIERMVQSLSDLMGRGRGDLMRSEIDLVELVGELVQEHEHRTARAFEYVSTAPEMIGEWDGLRLERLLDNLFSNATKYSKAPAEVLVSLSAEGDGAFRHAVIEVRDFGIGIPAADQRDIFQRFRRGSNTARIPGKGVGLASVRQIVEEHHGTVAIQSAVGEGTTITVRLPWPEDVAPDLPEPADDLPIGSDELAGNVPPRRSLARLAASRR